jgi:hypothetical protein
MLNAEVIPVSVFQSELFNRFRLNLVFRFQSELFNRFLFNLVFGFQSDLFNRLNLVFGISILIGLTARSSGFINYIYAWCNYYLFCNGEVWSITFREEEHTLQMFEKKVLRKIFESKKD